MLGDDTVQIFWRAIAVPDPFRVDDGDGPVDADSKAVRLSALDAPFFGKPELLQAHFEMFPGFER